jgi:lysyl-tRNA synthetase class 2
LSEMTEQSGPDPAAPLSGEADRPERPAGSSARALDRRQQRRWVPLVAGLLSLFIGITYIVEGISPSARHRLHGVDYLGSVTRTADLIIGLALVMVSHGLRRRKRRAWEATVALLAFGLISHTVLGLILRHVAPEALRPAIRPAAAVGTALVLLGFIWFRRDFYAVGDRGSRWHALWVLCYLVAADVLIGLA